MNENESKEKPVCDSCGEKSERNYYYRLTVEPVIIKQSAGMAGGLVSRKYNVCVVCMGDIWMQIKRHFE